MSYSRNHSCFGPQGRLSFVFSNEVQKLLVKAPWFTCASDSLQQKVLCRFYPCLKSKNGRLGKFGFLRSENRTLQLGFSDQTSLCLPCCWSSCRQLSELQQVGRGAASAAQCGCWLLIYCSSEPGFRAPEKKTTADSEAPSVGPTAWEREIALASTSFDLNLRVRFHTCTDFSTILWRRTSFWVL
jgi:hypothetical protein